MCGTVDEKTFLLLFELLGEAIYISSYREHPVTFQSEAVPSVYFLTMCTHNFRQDVFSLQMQYINPCPAE